MVGDHCVQIVSGLGASLTMRRVNIVMLNLAFFQLQESHECEKLMPFPMKKEEATLYCVVSWHNIAAITIVIRQRYTL